MSESELLDDIFYGKKWRGKYKVSWCDLCDTAIITCPKCKNGSCNGGGCEECINDKDSIEFNEVKTRVEDYLTEEEIKIYQKCLELKKYILETVRDGDKEIDWNKLDKNGKLSDWNRKMFIK
jgi:methionyl-tRNA synthetase